MKARPPTRGGNDGRGQGNTLGREVPRLGARFPPSERVGSWLAPAPYHYPRQSKDLQDIARSLIAKGIVRKLVEIESRVRGVKCKKYHGSWALFFNWSRRRLYRSLRTTDVALAVKLLKQVEEELSKPGATLSDLSVMGARDTGNDSLTIRKAIDAFREKATDITLESRTTYCGNLDRWLVGRQRHQKYPPAIYADWPVTFLKRRDVRDILRAVRKKKNGNGGHTKRATADVVRTSIQKLFTWAIEEFDLRDPKTGDELQNPAERLAKATRDADLDRLAPRRRGRPFEPAEVDRLLAALKQKEHDLWLITLISLKAGLRVGEVCALQFDDIDFDRDVIHVRRHWTTRSGIVNGTKNKRAGESTVREVPLNLSAILTSALRDHVKSRREQHLKRGWGTDCRWLFPTISGTALDSNNASRHIVKAMKQAGIKNHIFHDTRHTFASMLLVATNGNVDFVARCLGDTIAVTAESYLHVIGALKPSFPHALDGNVALPRSAKQ